MQKRDSRNASRTNQNNIGRKSRRGKKAAVAVSAAIGAIGVFGVSQVHAQAIIEKDSNLGPLNTTADWTPAQVPTAGNVAQFSNVYSAPVTTLLLGGSMTWGGISVVNPTNDVIIGNTPGLTLTLGGTNGGAVNDGIDLSTSTVNATIATGLILAGSQLWQVDAGHTLTLSGNITDESNAINNTGVGTVLITGTIGGSGTFTETTGIVEVGSSGALSGVDFNQSGGIFEIRSGTTATTIGAVIGTSNIGLTNTAGTAVALSVGSDNDNATYTGVFSGSGSFNFAGNTNTMVLVGNNSYTGTTTISGGTLQIGNGGIVGSLGSTTLPITDNGTLVYNLNKNITIGNVIVGSGSLTTALTNHTMLLTAANSFSGVMTIGTGDTLFLGNSSAISNANLAFGDGETLNFGTLTAATIGALSGGNATDVITAPGANFVLTLGTATNANDNVYNGSLAGGSATATLKINDNGAGVVQLAGPNSFTGTLDVASGTLEFGNGGTTGWSANVANSGTITDAGTIIFDLTTPITVTNVISNGTPNVTNVTITTGLATGIGSLTISSASTVTLTASNSFTGTTIINGGLTTSLLQLGNVNALAGSTLNYNNFGGNLSFGTLTAAVLGALSGGQALSLTNNSAGAVALSIGNTGTLNTYTGVFSGTGSVNKIGTGVEVLSGASNFTGGTTVTSGQLTITNALSLGVPASNVMVSILNNATLSTSATGGFTTSEGMFLSGNDALTLQGSTLQITGNLNTVSGGNLVLQGGGTLELAGANPGFSDAIIIGNGNFTGSILATLEVGNGTAGSIATLGTMGGRELTDNGTLAFNLPAGTATMTNIIEGTGAVSQSGITSTLILSGANTYTGNTIVNAGILQLGVTPTGTSSALGNGAANGILNLAAAGTLDMHSFSDTVGGLTGTGLIDNLSASPVTLTVGNNNNFSSAFAGTLQNSSAAVSLVVSGTGALALTGVNSYSGSTTISSGVLQVNNFANDIFLGQVETLGTGSLGNTSSITIGNGKLEVLGNATTNNYSTAIPIQLTSTASTIQVDNLAGQPTALFEIDSNITGTGGLNKTNNGTLILTGSNTYAGSTTITADANGVGVLQIGNGTLGSLASLGTGPVTDNGTLTFNLPQAQTTLSALISGTGQLIQNGTTSLTLSGSNNTYSGNTIVQSGTLLLGNRLALQTSTLNYNNQGGSFSFGVLTSAVFGGLSGTQVLPLINSVGQDMSLTVGTNNTNDTYNGNLGAGAGSSNLTKVGIANLILGGTNTYHGGTVVDEGNLEFANSNAFSGTATGGILVNSSGTVSLDTGVAGLVTGGNGVVNTSSIGALGLTSIDAATNINFTTSPFSSYTNMSLGAGSGNLTYTGTITPAGGNYRLGGGNTLTLPNIQLTGTNGLIVENGGEVSLTGLNTYTGVTQILGSYPQVGGLTTVTPYVDGVLSVTSVNNGGLTSPTGAAPNFASNMVINGGDFVFAGAADTTDRLFTIGSGSATLTSSGSGPLVFTNTGAIGNTNVPTAAIAASNINGTTITGLNTAFLTPGMTLSDSLGDLPAGTSIVSISGNTVVINNTGTSNVSSDTITIGNQSRNLVLNGTTPNNVLDSALSNPVGGTLSVIETSGEWDLGSTNNTYSGPTILQGGELGFEQGAVSPNTTLEFLGGIAQINGLTPTLPATLNATTFNGGFDITNPAATLSLNVALSGTGSLTKTGAGTLALTAANVYTGATTINEGTLNLNSTGGTTLTLGSLTGVTVGGGTLLFTGGTSSLTQSLLNTTLASGSSTISVVDSGSNTDLALGQLIPLTGATAVFSTTANGTITYASFVGGGFGSNGIITTATGAPIGVIGTNWAAGTTTTNGTVGPLTSYISPVSGTSALGTTGNYDIVNSGEMRASSNTTFQSIRFNTPLGGYYIGSGISYPAFSAVTGNTQLTASSSIRFDQIFVKSSDAFSVGGFLMTANTGTNNVYITTDQGSLSGNATLAIYRSLSATAGNEITFIQQNTLAGMYLLTGIADRGGTAIVKDGAGTVYSAAYAPVAASTQNQWQGPTYINGGTWAIANDTGLGGVSTNASQMTNPVILNGGTLQALGTFSLNTSANPGIAGSNDRPVQLGANGGTIDVTSNSGTANVLTITGLISGPGALTKTDGGTLVATNNNTYTGGTNINGGAIQVDNSSGRDTGTGLVNVNNGGSLIGVGTVNAQVNLNTGGILSPGDPGINLGVGTFTVGTLNVNSGGAVNFDEVGGQNHADEVLIENGLAFNDLGVNGIDLFLQGTTNPFNNAGTYTLFSVNGPVSGNIFATTAVPTGGLDSLATTSSLINLNGVLNATYTIGTVVTAGVTSVNVTINGGSTAGIWNSTGAGSPIGWNNPANWSGQEPTGAGASASFLTSPGITAPTTIQLGANQTAGYMVFNNSNGYTIDGTTNNATLALDYGGATAVVLDNLGNQVISAPVVLNSNAVAEVISPNPTDTLTFSGPISSRALSGTGLNIEGTGTVILSNNNTYTGPTQVSSALATLQIGNGGATGTLGVSTANITDNGTLAFDVQGMTTVANQILGAGNLVQNSPVGADLLVTGTNYFQGNSNILSGTLSLGGPSTTITLVVTSVNGNQSVTQSAGPLGANATVAFGANGTLDLNGYNFSMGTLAGPSGTIDNLTAGGGPTLNIGSLNTNTTWGGVITNSSGSINVTKSGSGTITFTNTNTYTGVTSITAGAILADVTNAISPNSSITTVNINDGLILGPNVTLSSTFNIASANVGELMDVPVGNAVYAGNINLVNSGGNQYRMGISGTGSLTLTGNTVYTGTNLFFDTKGNIVYGGNATIRSGAGWGFGRSTGFGVAVLLENNASLTFAGGVSSGNGVAQNYQNLQIQDDASANITGGFDLENSTVTSSSTTVQLNGGTLGASYFFQTQNPTSPGFQQGGNTSLPNGVVDGTYLNLNGGVLTMTSQVGTNAFLPTINDLSILDQTGGALFNSNGNIQKIATPLNTGGGSFVGDGGVQKLGLGTTILSGINPSFGTSGGTNSTYFGPTIVKGGLLELADPWALGGPYNVPTQVGGPGGGDGLFDQIAIMRSYNLALGFTPSVTVNVGGAAGFEGGTISGSNNSNYFISTLEQNNTGGSPQINLGSLALDGNSATTNGFTADSSQNIDYTHVAVGGGGITNNFTSGGAFSMDNPSLVNMSIGALSAGITYTGTITPGAAGYLVGGGGTITFTNTNAFTGSTNVTAENGGVVAVPSANNYSGTTTIKGSYIMADPYFVTQPFQSTVMSISQLTNGGVAGSLGTSSNAASNLVLDGGTLQFVGSTTGSTDRLFTLTSAGATLDASGFQAPVGSNAPLPQPMVFVNTGSDVSTDMGTYTGNVTVGTSLGLPATIINLTSGDTHGMSVGSVLTDLSGDGLSGATIVGLTPNSIILGGTTTYAAASGQTFTNTFQPRNLTLTGTGVGVIDSNLVDGQALSVTKNGTGTWSLAGTNTYSGGTTLNAGTLQINTNASMGSNLGTATLNGGILEVLSSITTSRNFITGTAAPTIQLDGGDTYEIDGIIANGQTGATALAAAGTIAGGLNLTGTGLAILTGSNSYTGTTRIGAADVLQIGNGGSSGQVIGNIVDNNVLNLDRTDAGLTLGGTISGSGTVNQTAAGTTTITGGNSYTGLTTITAGGTLNINSIGGIPLYNATIGSGNVTNNGQLNINADSVVGNVTGTGSAFVLADTEFVPQTLFQSSLVNNGHSQVALGGTVGSVSGVGDLTINGGQFLDSGALNQGAFANNGNTTINGGPSVIGGIPFTAALGGTGTLTLNGTNTLKLALRSNTPVGSFSLTPVSTQGTITISPTAQLDITDNTVVLSGFTSAAVPNAEYGWAGAIGTGYHAVSNNPTFTGPGIVSSQVAAKNAAHSDTHLYAVAYAWTGDLNVTNVIVPGTTQTYSQTYGSSAFIITPAIVGDANLDGIVNYTDFQILSANLNSSGTNWDQANFNGGAKTTYTDFQLLSANINDSTQLDNAEYTSMEDVALAHGQTMTANADGIGFTLTNVPEPASLTLIGGTMAALGFIRPRRRKNKAENEGGAKA